MCGIFGYIGKKNIPVKRATDIIEHRGPDAEGFLHYLPDRNEVHREPDINNSALKVSMGFRRLAIIDLAEHANQPFSDESGRYHLTFNGEIYNYLELREELCGLGVEFRTNSDTEVFLQAYIAWGTDCFNKFNGMWAAVILDCDRGKVIGSRDRFGIKPFFYHVDAEGEIYWASEIKQFFVAGVEKKLNEEVIRDFIDKNIVDSTEETFFAGIFHLKAGTFMEVHLEWENRLRIRHSSYWTLRPVLSFAKLDYPESLNQFRELFLDCVKLRFRSDVPVGSCLSGGLDSSSIVASAAHQFDFPIHTFTSRFDIEAYDESRYVHLLADHYKSIQTHFCQLTEQLFCDQIDQVLYHQDEPFGSMGILAQWEVMKLAKKNGVIVLLDGQGGDELLAGYRKFYAFYLREKLVAGEIGKFVPALTRLLFNREFRFFDWKEMRRYLPGGRKGAEYYSSMGEALSSNAIIGFGGAKTMQQRSKLDVEKFSFPPLLRFEDRNSMAFSVETRVPFMDYRLVEFLYSISADYKIRKGYTKAILRDGLNGILPDGIRKRISKLGFATPQEVWMAGKLRGYFADYFAGMDNPYFANDKIAEAFKHYPKARGFSSPLFWRIYCFDKWYNLHFG